MLQNGTNPVSETEVEKLPVVLNGQILPSGVDRFAFKARKGMRLVAAASARNLMPYLADAVPGWFQATLTLYDPDGNEVAYAEDFRFQPDPVLHYTIPADGRYVLEIRDELYRGRQDFVYRVVIGELPYVTSIFPLGSRDTAPATVELRGWNLPVDRFTVNRFEKGPRVFPIFLPEEQQTSGSLLFARDTLPECLEQEPNDRPEIAQPVTLPVIVNGRIDRPGDWDVFRFEGRAGSRIVAEVTARRLGSPLDSLIKLTDASGRLLAVNDDFEDQGAPLVTHQADSWLWTTLPADGTYYLHLGDTQHQGGPAYAYRLRIGPPRPIRTPRRAVEHQCPGGYVCADYGVRRPADRFAGDIALNLRDARLDSGWAAPCCRPIRAGTAHPNGPADSFGKAG